ncbi:hypothetical protein [Nostocoides veronense]|uniref:GerMN domain-containing protein n=1 Tax=Nostocoides veronense TaxID=330836 RepID=A0ABN2LV00_9MICO
MTTDDLRDLEDSLRGALQADASAVTPSERLAAIQDAVRMQSAPAPRHTRWLVLVAAAAAVAMVATATVLAMLPGRSGTGDPAATGSSTTVLSTTPSDPASAPPNTVLPGAVPIYLLVRDPSSPDGFGLTRTFLRKDDPRLGLPADATPGQVIAAALAWTGRRSDGPGTVGPSGGLDVQSVDISDERITITAKGLDDAVTWTAGVLDRARLSLILTAQAIVGRGDIPVRFISVEGYGVVRGADINQDFHRPPPTQIAALASPIWLDRPGWDETLTAGVPQTFSGLSTHPGAVLSWRIDGGPTAQSGEVRVGDLVPQAPFTITLDPLAAGSYTLRVQVANDPNTTVTIPLRAE